MYGRRSPLYRCTTISTRTRTTQSYPGDVWQALPMAGRGALFLWTALTIAAVAFAEAAGPPDGAGHSQCQLGKTDDAPVHPDHSLTAQLQVSDHLTDRVRREVVVHRKPFVTTFDQYHGEQKFMRQRKVQPRPKKKTKNRPRRKNIPPWFNMPTAPPKLRRNIKYWTVILSHSSKRLIRKTKLIPDLGGPGANSW